MEKNSNFYVGIDLGGTKIAGILADEEGKILEEKTVPTIADEGHEKVIQRIKSIFTGMVEKVSTDRVQGVGVCAPGPLNIKSGTIIHAPNLRWKNLPIVAILEQELGLPVLLENDANAAGYGEYRFGAGKGSSTMMYMTVSTGIGGGIINNGGLIYGRDYAAGEVGHTVILPNGPLCGCGQRGCIEAVASGTAIAREARSRLRQGEKSIIPHLVKGDLTAVSAREVAAAARQGDNLAKSVLDEAFSYLGMAIGNFINILNPDTIVIGGGVSKMGDLLFTRINKTLQNQSFQHMVEGVKITPAVLGSRAGTLGVVALVQKKTTSKK